MEAEAVRAGGGLLGQRYLGEDIVSAPPRGPQAAERRAVSVPGRGQFVVPACGIQRDGAFRRPHRERPGRAGTGVVGTGVVDSGLLSTRLVGTGVGWRG
jgi:hypothetical protein